MQATARPNFASPFSRFVMKPALPSGFRDLTPADVVRRDRILHIIRRWFQRYNFLPIETPAVELTAVLEGKYGTEGEKLLFRILKNADELQRHVAQLSPRMPLPEIIRLLSTQALRYDLTVPLARYVAMHKNEIRFPFKRYQIQPVWRGEKPQRGRYREFLQCDADIVGAPLGIADAEVVTLAVRIFAELEIPFQLHLNDRRILHALAEGLGVPPEKRMPLIITLDKLDKIGIEGVTAAARADDLLDAGAADTLGRLYHDLSASTTAERLQRIAPHLSNTEPLTHLHRIFRLIPESLHRHILFDPFLARGLDYYTATIFEVTVPDTPIGSIAGGGRYDELGALFGLRDTPAVGISFGIDRILDVISHLGMQDPHPIPVPELLITYSDAESEADLFALTDTLRAQGIRAEMFNRPVSLKKQLRYAQQTGIPYVLIAFPDELAHGRGQLKHLPSGTQRTVSFDDLPSIVRHG